MTPADVISEVRQLVQDARSPFRYTDTMLLGFVNQTIKRMALLRPDLFTTITDIPTTANTVVQDLPAGALRLVDIFHVKDGDALEEVDRNEATRAFRSWPRSPAGTPTKYMRHPRNPTRYFLFPAPVSGTVLIGEYVQTPPNYELWETIGNLSNAYFPVLVDGTVYLTESIDNEHVNTGRAKLFFESFVQTLGASLQSRVLADTDTWDMLQQRQGGKL